MVVDDDDVAFHRTAVHLSDEATLPRAALLAEASVGAGVELMPERARLRQRCQFGPVARLRRFLPRCNRAVMLNLVDTAEDGLISQIV